MEQVRHRGADQTLQSPDGFYLPLVTQLGSASGVTHHAGVVPNRRKSLFIVNCKRSDYLRTGSIR